MQRHENLLVTTMEECAEIQQSISKLLRFGDMNYCSEQDTIIDNNYHILKEFEQLKEMFDILFENHILEDLTEEQKKEIRNNKRIKTFKYIEEAEQLGLIN